MVKKQVIKVLEADLIKSLKDDNNIDQNLARQLIKQLIASGEIKRLADGKTLEITVQECNCDDDCCGGGDCDKKK